MMIYRAYYSRNYFELKRYKQFILLKFINIRNQSIFELLIVLSGWSYIINLQWIQSIKHFEELGKYKNDTNSFFREKLSKIGQSKKLLKK
jgi:hypothetical protein